METNLVPSCPQCCDTSVIFLCRAESVWSASPVVISVSLSHADKIENGDVYQRRKGAHSSGANGQEAEGKSQEEGGRAGSSWRRILLLILAITIHNIPGQHTMHTHTWCLFPFIFIVFSQMMVLSFFHPRLFKLLYGARSLSKRDSYSQWARLS